MISLTRCSLSVLGVLRRLALGPLLGETFPGAGFHGYLESPGRSLAAGTPLTVLGWVLSTGVPIKALSVRLDEASPEAITLRLRRGDLARIFPGLPGAASCGFRKSLGIPRLDGATRRVTVEVRAQLEDGSEVICFRRRVRVIPPPDAAARAGPLLEPGKGLADTRLPADWRHPVEALTTGQTDSGGRSTTPDCSIVIPVLGQCGFTHHCLVSLLRVGAGVSFEVIVVDNGSRDDTAELLEAFGSSVRVLRNRENRGFVTACNQGAAVARGRHLVFLNNDTEVRPGWLDRLVETAEGMERVGAVGAKLVYPNGLLQEAGGIVFSDGSAANYGRAQEPTQPELAYLREVDYCSAACLLVPRSTFLEVGGFDKRYSPGYYEDTDLCFALRERGLRVLYQPLAEVVHLEGGTAGTDVSTGLKRHQEVNRESFVARWAAALARQTPPGRGDLAGAADRRDGPRMLFVDYQIPKPDEDSGSVRCFAVVSLLARLGCRVSFLLPLGAPFDRYCRDLGGVGVRVVSEELVGGEVAAGRYDLAVVARVEVAERWLPTLRALCPSLPVVFDTVDVHFIREQREAELRDDDELRELACRTREAELATARQATLTLTVTEVDRDHLLRADPTLKVAILPNIHESAGAVPPREGRSALMFVGGFAHPPNVDAALYLVRDVMPAIRRELGEVELLLVGSKPTGEIKALAGTGVVVTGKVARTGPFYERSMVFVAPLRYGSGMKGKIGEALSHGVPVVTTTVGAEGMGLLDGETVMIADSPEELAAAVVSLWRDAALWQRLSTQGKQYVEERFSPRAVRPLVEELRALALR